MGSKKKYIITGIILLVICSLSCYNYYKHTPTYTFNLIKASIQEHDYDTFSKHVDTESIISSAYDSIMENALKDADLEDGTPIYESLVNMVKNIKPTVVNGLNERVKHSFMPDSAESEDTYADEKAASAAERVKNNTNANSIKIKSIGSSRDEGDSKFVSIIVTDTKLDKDFTIDIRMKQLDDGTWRILEISNLSDYIYQLQNARIQKLAELNKPITDEINKSITVGSSTLSISSGGLWGFFKNINIAFPVIITSDKQINDFEGTVIIRHSDIKPLNIAFTYTITNDNKNLSLEYSYTLNPFTKSGKRLMNSDTNDCAAEITINKISYADGSVIELKKELD